MLPDILEKVKAGAAANKRALYVGALVILIGLGSFGLGRLSSLWPKKEPLRIEYPAPDQNTADIGLPVNHAAAGAGANNAEAQAAAQTPVPTPATTGNYVASRNGTAYHLPTCPGAKQIKDENKIWFATRAEAERAGYKPAGNCPGLK